MIGRFFLEHADPKLQAEEAKRKADIIWNLFLDGAGAIQCRELTWKFCSYFLHVFEAALHGCSIPRRIPIEARVDYELRAMSAFSTLKAIEEHPDFIRYFLRSRNFLEQGQVLVAYLELIISRYEYQDALRDLKDLLKEQTHLKSLTYVETERLSNFLATLIGRYCSKDLKRPPQVHEVAWHLFDFILTYSGKVVQEVASVLLRKLEGLEVAAFLAFALRATQHFRFSNLRKYTIDTQELLVRFQGRYGLLQSTIYLVRFVNTLHIDNPLVHSSHRVMTWLCNEDWMAAWEAERDLRRYKRLCAAVPGKEVGDYDAILRELEV